MRLIILACLIVLGAPALLWAQGQPQGGYYEVDFDRQRQAAGQQGGAVPAPSQGSGDALLVDLFSDGNQSGNVQSSGGTNLQNLPGTPSPVTNPASQGEAVIERATGGTTPTEASPLKSRAKEPRVKVRLSPSQQVYLHAAKAWIPPDASVNGCRSLLYNRELYHVQCVNLVSSLDEEFYRGYPYKHRK